MKELLIPEMRFNDAQGREFPEWKERRIKEISNLKSGWGFPLRYQGETDLPYPFYKVSDMNLACNGKYMKRANNYIDLKIKRAMKVKVINQSAVIFAKVGAAVFLERKRIAYGGFALDNNMMALLPNEDLEFIYYVLNRTRLAKYSQVGALPSYNASDVGAIKIKIPIIEEQQKIASFLSQIDNSIESQEGLVSHLELVKKGLLQKIFSQELRFRDENGGEFGEWEEKKLGDISLLKNGYAFKSENYLKDENGRYRIITISDVTREKYVGSKVGNTIKRLPNSIQKHQLLKNGDILISMTGNVGRVSINRGANNLLNQRVGLIVPNGVEKEYLFYLLNTENFENRMIATGQGAAQLNIGKKDILSYKIMICNTKEQKKIADFLSAFDEKIDLEKEKLSHWEEVKKGLLQKMFV